LVLGGRDWWRPVPVERALVPAIDSGSSVLAYRALMLFMFALLISPQSFFPPLGSLHLAALSAAVAICAHATYAARHGRPLLPHYSGLRWAAALACWALLMVPLSIWPGGSASLLFGLYFKSLVIFWLLAAVVDTRVRLRTLMTWLSLLTVPIAVTAIAHYLTGQFVAGGDRSAPRIEGYDAPLTGNPNDLALVMCMLLPLALALAASAQRLKGRLLFLAIAALELIAVVLTFSRTGFVTLAALFVFGVFRVLRGSARAWALVAILFAGALVPLIPGGYLEHMSTITAIESDPTGSAQNRWSDSLLAAQLVLANPIVGAGPGMSTLALNEVRGPAWVPVHNVYLEYATDLGIPGLLLFLCVLVACVRGVQRVLRESAGIPAARELHSMAVGVQLTLVAFMVAGLFHPVAYHFHFYYAAGLAAALVASWENEHVRAA
jgi:O-antigen ligase